MRRTPFLPLVATVVLGVLGLIAGCGTGDQPLAPAQTTVGPGGGDEQEIVAVLGMVPELDDDGLFADAEETAIAPLASGAGALNPGASPFAPITPLRFWRHIESVNKRFEFEFTRPDTNGVPQAAVVTIHRLFRGTFNILTPIAGDTPTDEQVASSGDPSDPPDLRLVRKRLADHWVRRVLLRRVQLASSDRVMWRVAATSGIEVTSRDLANSTDNTTTSITSLAIHTATKDTVITDPLEFIFLRKLLKVMPGEKVELTATTESPDDVVLLLHRGQRFRFRNNGDGTHSGAWVVPDHGGIHHFGVNALSRGTLFDDEEPYSSNAWILPYVTHAMERDYMP